MANIQKYSDKFPSLGNLELNQFILNVPKNFDSIELSIIIRKEKLNVKEFSSYLNFIYRVDGHLSAKGLLSYSHYPENQIAINDIRIGSYEIIFEWLRNMLDNNNNVIIIFLTLKFLPKVIQSYLDTVYKGYEIANLREDYLEKVQKRENKEQKISREKKEKRAYKKELRELIEEELPKLNKKQREKLVEIVAQLYIRIGYRNVSAARFAQKVIEDIKLKPKKKKGS